MPQVDWIDNNKMGKDNSVHPESAECGSQPFQDKNNRWGNLLRPVSSLLSRVIRTKKVRSGQQLDPKVNKER